MQHVAGRRRTHTIRFARPGIELNLGRIGKGYALDRMGAAAHARLVRAVPIGRRQQLASAATDGLGGTSARGRSPNRVSRACGCATARSPRAGAGEQFVDVDGKRYGSLDPRTDGRRRGHQRIGRHAQAAVADALSTAFLVGGEDLAARVLRVEP